MSIDGGEFDFLTWLSLADSSQDPAQSRFQLEVSYMSYFAMVCFRCLVGINAITGGKRDEKPPDGLQDYVVGGKQPWLDGIATAPGVVRQVYILVPS